MKELQAKWVFEQGLFKALVACAPMGTGYHLHLVKFGRQSGYRTIELQRGAHGSSRPSMRLCKTARNIGFRRVGSRSVGDAGLKIGTASEARGRQFDLDRGGGMATAVAPGHVLLLPTLGIRRSRVRSGKSRATCHFPRLSRSAQACDPDLSRYAPHHRPDRRTWPDGEPVC